MFRFKWNYFTLFLLLPFVLHGQEGDSMKVYWFDPVDITGKKMELYSNSLTIQRDNLENLLAYGGISLIKKGVFFAQDVYADGLKKGDINIVIDGERFHPACVNRMDAPVSRINPLEMETLELMKGSSGLQSGIGGVIALHRKSPGKEPFILASAGGVAGASSAFDLSVAGGLKDNRLSLHFVKGTPYTNGDGKAFSELYGYKDNYNFTLAEASYQGETGEWRYGASVAYTENITFPYLQMDERFNRLFSANVSYKGHKIYANYTSHLMNNDLRASMMQMETDARNLTIGVVGSFYEAYFRKWNSDNFIKMPTMLINNALMPGVNQYFASVSHQIKTGDFTFGGKAGVSYFNLDKEEVKTYYQRVWSDPKTTSFFPVVGLSAAWSQAIGSEFAIGVMAEAAAELPETEALFVAVRRAPTGSSWVGNPNLNQPLKTGLRATLLSKIARLELYANHVSNYVYLDRKSAGGTNFVTYRNINAMLAGANFAFEYKFIDILASYTWAENRSDATPLAEIMPLRVVTKLTSPKWMDMVFFVRHTWSDGQTRVDPAVSETVTPAWNRLDAGVSGEFRGIKASLEVENITNANYQSHLSYFRDPFKAGFKVYEPGLMVRLNFGYGL